MKNAKVLCGAMALLVAAGTASAQWDENFDGYPLGPLNQGGWDGWDGDPGVYGIVTTDQARSAPQSLAASGGVDAVHGFGGAYTAGQWTFTGHIYVPGNMDDNTYWIIQNVYNDFGPYDWTVQIVLDPFNGTVNEDMQEFYGDGQDDGYNYLTLITDAWVEIRCEFDVDNNYVETYYDGQLLSWGDLDTNLDGAIEIANLDLYGPQLVDAYHDDLSIVPAGGDPCAYADCNGDGTVNTQDFLCYLGKWSAGDASADCNGDGTVNTVDFLCYLGQWSDCR